MRAVSGRSWPVFCAPLKHVFPLVVEMLEAAPLVLVVVLPWDALHMVVLPVVVLPVVVLPVVVLPVVVLPWDALQMVVRPVVAVVLPQLLAMLSVAVLLQISQPVIGDSVWVWGAFVFPHPGRWPRVSLLGFGSVAQCCPGGAPQTNQQPNPASRLPFHCYNPNYFALERFGVAGVGEWVGASRVAVEVLEYGID